MANVQHIFTGTQDPDAAGLTAVGKNGHHYTDTSTGDVYISNGDEWLMVAMGGSNANFPFSHGDGEPTEEPIMPTIYFDRLGDGTSIYIASITADGLKWVKLSAAAVQVSA